MDGDQEKGEGAELKQENTNIQSFWGNDYIPQIIYKPRRRKRTWLWITLAAILVFAAVLPTAVFTSGTQGREIKGNAGVVALYDFFQYQKDTQSSLESGMYKELGKRLISEPFEIESQVKVSLDSFGNLGVPINNITLGLDAKYDMKDFGLRMNALGIDLAGAYLIGDDVVVDMGGKAGSLKLTGLKGVDRSMSLSDRLKAVLPFLPDNDLLTDILEKVSLSVPDSTVSKDHQDVYSPKEDKKVRMNVITVKIDAAAIKQIAQSFSDSIKGDKNLSRKIQNTIDGFTGFAGLGSQDISGLLSNLVDLSGSDDLKDINVTMSVYQKEGTYTGVSLNFSQGDKKFSYTMMYEINGKEEYMSTDMNLNGTEAKNYYRYTWQDSQVKLSGRITENTGGSAGDTTQAVNGTIGLTKGSANEYKLAGNMTIDGNIYSEFSTDKQNKITVNMGIDADIKTGGGLGTLKESKNWKGIYSEKWGDLKDMLKGLFPSYGSGNDFLFPGQADV